MQLKTSNSNTKTGSSQSLLHQNGQEIQSFGKLVNLSSPQGLLSTLQELHQTVVSEGKATFNQWRSLAVSMYYISVQVRKSLKGMGSVAKTVVAASTARYF